MPLIETHNLAPGRVPYQAQVYNALDCAVTHEVHGELARLSAGDTNVDLIYAFERALQAPALEMMLRGFKIDEFERQRGIAKLRGEEAQLRSTLDTLAQAAWGRELNPRSPKVLKDFFYGAMKLPESWSSHKGVRKLSMNRETLEKLEAYFYARPFIGLILAIREVAKRLEVLTTEVGSDGRMRTSYNIAGTETGRWSSSTAADGSGTNLQNITPELRRIFVSDPGWKLCNIDLEQTESFDVGWLQGTLFDDWRYLDACQKGDLHTQVARLVWPNLGWAGELATDRTIADGVFYRGFSYRDMAKRGGHACLTKGHEVLTRDGWVDISTKPPEILTWSEKGSTFSRVAHWTDTEYSGNLIKLTGTSLELLATPNHRIAYYKAQHGKLYVSRADSLTKGSIPLGNNYIGGTEQIAPTIARLIAAYQSDGHQKSTNRVEFHFHKDRKFMRLEMLALDAGIEFEKRGDKAFLHATGWPKYAGAYMLNWSREAIAAFIDEYKHWDGHISETAVSLCAVNIEQLEWLQTLGRLVGIGGNLQKPQKGINNSILYRLQQNNRQYADIGSIKLEKTIPVSCRVYCPTVPTEFFFVRRNGRISVTGNTNYLTTPFTMSRHLKIPIKLAEDFQAKYAYGQGCAFPAFAKWWQWTAQELQTKQELTTPLGRKRHFFGRPNDDATLREAIAFVPQSTTADRMNLGLWRMWKRLGASRIQLLGQVHDSVIFEFHEGDEGVVGEALELTKVPLRHGARSMTVGAEAKVGWNWGAYDQRANPDGLIKWSSAKPDSRERTKVRTL